MASKCSTALVDPPSAMLTVIAFSKALRVMMCRGRMPRLIRSTTAAPARVESSRLCSETASCAELFGRLMPERLDRRGHGVRRVHAGAGAGPGNRRTLDELELDVRDRALRMAADRLEHRDDVAPVSAPGRMVPP